MTTEQHLEQLIGNMALRICVKDAELDGHRARWDDIGAVRARLAELDKAAAEKAIVQPPVKNTRRSHAKSSSARPN